MYKPVVFIFILFVLLLSGCGKEGRFVLIKNYSNQSVTYTMIVNKYPREAAAIEPGEEAECMVSNAFSHSMGNFYSSPVNDSIYYTQTDDEYYFYNISPVPSSIFNTLTKDVILSANGAISVDPMTVPALQEIKTETILSNTPIFSAKTAEGYPVMVSFNIIENTYMIILK